MYKDYENYNSTAKHYDSTRYAYGIDVIIGYMVMLNKNNLKILDVGCGTGNFLVAIKTVTAKNKNLQKFSSGVSWNRTKYRDAKCCKRKKFNYKVSTRYGRRITI